MEDTEPSQVNLPLTGMMTRVHRPDELVTPMVLVGLWFVVGGGLAFLHWSGLPILLFLVLGPIIVVAAAVGWIIRKTFEAAAAFSGMTLFVALLASLVDALVQFIRVAFGPHAARSAAVLGWACLTACLTFAAWVAVAVAFDEQECRRETVARHARIAQRVREHRWFGRRRIQPPVLFAPLAEIPGVYGYELSAGSGFEYAVVAGERVILVCLGPPPDIDRPEELATHARQWQERLRNADSQAQVDHIMVLSAEAPTPPPADEVRAMGVVIAPAGDLFGTVGPLVGEPDHVNIAIATLLMPPARA